MKSSLKSSSLVLTFLCSSLLALPLLACGNDGGSNDDDGVNSPDASTPSADAETPGLDAAPTIQSLADARQAPDGAANIRVEGVTVTYARPAIGTDPAGFFVQEGASGPALFVAVDASSLSPSPAAGDVVSMTITEMATSAQLRQATAVAELFVSSSDADLAALTQDVSDAADLVSALGSYEAELVSAGFTVTASLGGAGPEHQAGPVNTTAISDNADLRLRVSESVQSHFGLVTGCTGSVSAPMWRFNEAAQLSAWANEDLDVQSCPAPVVVSATPSSITEVKVQMQRAIDPASVTDAPAQFSFDGGLSTVSASVDGAVVTLTTSEQTGGQLYTLTVATSVQDILASGVDVASATASFNGASDTELSCDDGIDDDIDGFVDCFDSECSDDVACDFQGHVYLWEVDADQASTDSQEFVELRNMSGASVDLAAEGYYLLMVNGSDGAIYSAVSLTGSVADGALFVVGSDDATLAADQSIGSINLLQNGPDGVLLVQCATCTDATTDFPAALDLGTAATFTTAGGKTATKLDALAYDTDDDDVSTLLDALGVSGQFNENGSGDGEEDSNQRSSLSNWLAAPATPKASGIQP